MSICVIGLGVVGLPTAKYILEKGFDVWGYDINLNAVNRAKKEGIIKATYDWTKIPVLDVYVICVSTMIKDNVPVMSSIYDVCKKISQKADSSSLVSIESTIMPGISKKVYDDIFKKNIKLVHVPHRYYEKDEVKHGVKQLRIIGAMTSDSLELGLNFYRENLDIPLHIVSSIEVAEMCKITENSYRYVQIAFAEELRMISENIGLNFNEIRDACNTKWNIEILDALNGIGGYCLPKDLRYLASLTNYDTLLKCSIKVDEIYRRWLSQKT